MASIRVRNGRYTAQVRKAGFATQCETFSTKKDAEAWAKSVELEMERGLWNESTKAKETSLADVLRDYRDGRVKELKSAEQTTDRINVLLERNPRFEKISMLNLKVGDISSYIKKRQADEVAAATICRELDLLSSAINRAKADGLVCKNPIEDVDRPKFNNARDRRLRKGELVSLLRELAPRTREANGRLRRGGAGNCYVRWIVRFAIETAMRRSEILKLRWEYIDLALKTAHLPTTKNGTARDVPLSTRALRAIRAVELLNPGRKGLVFPVSADALKRCFTRATVRAEIHDLHFHDLRHEATSRLAEIFDLLELSAVTGHKDLASLKRYYHPDASKLAAKLAEHSKSRLTSKKPATVQA